jgi:hypothetical protein
MKTDGGHGDITGGLIGGYDSYLLSLPFTFDIMNS